MTLRTLLGSFAALVAVGCGTDDTPPGNPSSDRSEKLTVHFETAENTVDPGQETMTCEYLEPLDRDLVVTGFGTRQARGGHHMVLYRSIVPKAAGTIEDCSKAESMTNLLLALTQITTQKPGSSSIEFPEGMAVVVPAGTQLVTQSHYMNTTTDALTATDSIDIWLTDRDPSELDLLHLFVSNVSVFEIPPHTDGYSAKAGCTLPHEIDLLSVVPHMHEHGLRTHLKIGNGSASSVYEVPSWEPGWRDSAPITSFLDEGVLDAAGHFSAGDAVELECTWANDAATSLTFPNEMCSSAGYFRSDAPGAADITCLEPR